MATASPGLTAKLPRGAAPKDVPIGREWSEPVGMHLTYGLVRPKALVLDA